MSIRRWAICMLFLATGYGVQAQRPILIGIDVAKPVLLLLTPSRPAFRLAEATAKFPLTGNRFVSVVVGYGQLRSDTVFRNVLIDGGGGYLKIGSEGVKPGGLVIGWHALASLSRETGTYTFRGPVFGDYSQQAFRRNRFLVGAEGLLGHQWPLSKNFSLRATGRITVGFQPQPNGDGEPPSIFMPGIGPLVGHSLVGSVGIGVHLLYQINRQLSSN